MTNRIAGSNKLSGASWYVGIRLFAFLVITGAGMGFMYYADNCCHRMAVGIGYLTALAAVIVIILADLFEDELLKKLREKS